MKRPSKPFFFAVVALLAVAAGILFVDVHPSRVYASGHDWIFGAPPDVMPTCGHKMSCPDATVTPAYLFPAARAAAFDSSLEGLGAIESRAGIASGSIIQDEWSGMVAGY